MSHIREINKTLGWPLPTDDPKILIGLILEHPELFSDAKAGLDIGNFRLEIVVLKGVWYKQ